MIYIWCNQNFPKTKQVFEETCNSIKRIIAQRSQASQESEKQLQQEQEALLEADYQKAIAAIQNAQSSDELHYPANYFKGSKYEQNILNACQAKSDMEGWSAWKF